MPQIGKRPGSRLTVIPWLYDSFLWILSVLIELFFREVHPRGAWKVPRKGPVILVAAPHANQFVDSLILMRVLKQEAKRRISFLIAEKSTKRKFVGTMSSVMGSIPVGRALDKVKPAQGRIYLPDPDNDPTLVRGIGTDFKSGQFQVGGLIVLPKVGEQTPSIDIGEIISSEELRLKKPFKTAEALKHITNPGSDEERGTTFKVAPYVDQTKVYNAVFNNLDAGGCIGIFPEGGSHDRPDLLPLKPGVAIMALGALANNPDCGVQIIPIGMNYFHAHKFRSRAVIEFGNPIHVDPAQVAAYKAGDRRNAVGSLLDTVYQGLLAVTQSSPDYDTLMLAQAARRLYNPTGKKLPLPIVVELNRRLVKSYTKYADDPRIVDLKKDVHDYNRELRALRIRDHQVEWGNVAQRPWWYVLAVLLYRLGELLCLAIGTLPGLLMFWPVFVVTKYVSVRKSREALAASTVKIRGRDVVTTWKLLVAMAFAPALYIFQVICMTWWLSKNRQNSPWSQKANRFARADYWIPNRVPLALFAFTYFILCIMLTFAALRLGEIGMDVFKSLMPLFLALNPRSSDSLSRLSRRREALSQKVTDVINTLGPEVMPDFDHDRIVADSYRDGAYQSQYKKMPEPGSVTKAAGPQEETSDEQEEPGTPKARSYGQLPSNETFNNIGEIGFFASQPHTPKNHSRSSSVGPGTFSGLTMKSSSTGADTQQSLDEVSKRIRGAMRERGRKRENEGAETEDSWDVTSSSGVLTPKTDDELSKKDI